MRNWILRLHIWCNQHEWLLILLLVTIVLRLPSLCTPHYYGDEEIYFVMGRAWREGIPLYQAMFDHKPPLIYILAGVANRVFQFRLALLISMLVHVTLFWKLARLFWRSTRPRLAYVSSALFVILTSIPTFEGLIVNAELLMMLPVTLSLLLIWPHSAKATLGASEYSWSRYLIAGLVAGIGWLYKIPVMFDVIAIALYLFVFRPTKFLDSLKGLLKPSLWLYLGGFAIPLILTFAYYYLKGHGSDYLDTVLTVNLGYISSATTDNWIFNPFKSGLVVRGTILAGFTLLIYLMRNRMNKRLVLISLWFAFSLFGALLSYRPYPHYLQQPIVPFALLLPFIFVAERVWEWMVIALITFGSIFTQMKVKFWGYASLPLYQNFVRFMDGEYDREEYLVKFDNAKRNYEIAKYLNERLVKEDQIYVWGTDPTVYNLTHRLPTGGKYIVSFHVRDLNKYDYVMENIRYRAPRAIVVLTGAGEFNELMSYLEHNYLQTKDIDGNQIYLRMVIK